jgi:hypothetical protein
MRTTCTIPALLAILVAVAHASGQEAPPSAPSDHGHALDAGGWIFMLLSLAFVWGLALWCFGRVLRTPAHVEPGPAAKP